MDIAMPAARKQGDPKLGERLGLGNRLRAAFDWVQSQRAVTTPDGPDWPMPEGELPDLKVLVTAEEAYPEFERLVLGARTSLVAGFRIFDPCTRLMSDQALAVGDTWADLIAHALCRGVRVDLVISDFDPIAAPDLHRNSWASKRMLEERAAEAGCADALSVDVHMHPAQAGWPIRLAAARMALKTLRAKARWINDQGKDRRDTMLRDMPGLMELLVRRPDGNVTPRRGMLPPMRPVTHHQKIAVIDRTHLYVGGLDLDNRRADGKEHERAARRTWADVQVSLSGPIAAQAEDHLLAFRAEVERRQEPEPSRPGLLRTLSRRGTGLQRLGIGPAPTISEMLDATLLGIGQAETLIYLETQFLRDLHLARDLARRAREKPDLGLIVVLPSAPEDLAFHGARGFDMRFGEHLQARCHEILCNGFGDRATFVSPAQTRGVSPNGTRAVLHGAPVIYVHSKVSIFDDRFALVSSANLNGRSQRWDTEVGVPITDRKQILHLRERLMRHWLPEDAEADLLAPTSAPRAWRALAEANRERQPQKRRGFLLPYPSAAPRRFGRLIPGLTQDIV